MEKIRIFSDNEKNQVFDMYKNGYQLPKIADFLKVDFTPSVHKTNEKTGKETGTAAYVTINGNKYGLKQLLFYLDKEKAAIEYETANYVKGGRLVVDKVEAAKSKFLSTIGELVTIGTTPTLQNGEIDLNAVFAIATKQAAAMDKQAEKERAAAIEKAKEERANKRAAAAIEKKSDDEKLRIAAAALGVSVEQVKEMQAQIKPAKVTK